MVAQPLQEFLPEFGIFHQALGEHQMLPVVPVIVQHIAEGPVIIEGPVQIVKGHLVAVTVVTAAEIAQILLHIAVGGIALDDHPVDDTVHIKHRAGVGVILLLGHVRRPEEAEEFVHFRVILHRGLDDLHTFLPHIPVLGVEHLAEGFLHAVDAVVLAVDVENAEFVPLGQHLVRHVPAQGGKQLVPENGLGIVLSRPDAQGVVDLGAVLAVDRVVQCAAAVQAAEGDLEALLGMDQVGVAVHFNAAVDGKAPVPLKEGHIAGDLPIPFILGVNAAGAEHAHGIHRQGDHRQGVILVDDVAGGDHIVGQLALRVALGPDHRGLGQCQRAGVQGRIHGRLPAVQGVIDGAFPG